MPHRVSTLFPVLVLKGARQSCWTLRMEGTWGLELCRDYSYQRF